METEEINRRNKLIAEFMKYDEVDCSSCKHNYDCNHIQCGLTNEEKDELLQYHSNWNWLMQVIEKIEKENKVEVHLYSHHNWKEPYRVTIATWGADIIAQTSSESKIEGVWESIVKFIEGLNKQKQNKNA